MSTTFTVTKYLTYANATSTTSYSSYKPTGWNATSSTVAGTDATTIHQPTLTAAATSTSGILPPIATATGAACVQEINIAVAALAGAAALFWGSL